MILHRYGPSGDLHPMRIKLSENPVFLLSRRGAEAQRNFHISARLEGYFPFHYCFYFHSLCAPAPLRDKIP